MPRNPLLPGLLLAAVTLATPIVAAADAKAKQREAVVDKVLGGAERLPGTPEIQWQRGGDSGVVEVWKKGETLLIFTADNKVAAGGPAWRDPTKLAAYQAPVPLLRAIRDLGQPPLPEAPEGWTVKVLADAPSEPTRMLATDDALLVLARDGSVHRYDHATGEHDELHGKNYRKHQPSNEGDRAQDGFQGIALSPDGRLYLSGNATNLSPRENRGSRQSVHHATVYRTPAGDIAGVPKPWLELSWPAGVGTYGHGINDMGFDDAGLLYVSSGSRTDANEAGVEDDKGKDGEVRVTSAMLRIDPSIERPTEDDVEVFADGLRNTYGWLWLGGGDGRMVGLDSGPNANPPAELNFIEEGAHYGFPYRFSDWDRQPYLHVPPAPTGLELTDPVLNVGPAARGLSEQPIGTFEAHSSPLGLAEITDLIDAEQPTLLVGLFGNYVMSDLLHIEPEVLKVTLIGPDADGREQARVEPWLSDLGRVIDVETHGDRVYVIEFGRNRDGFPAERLPGRILMLERE